jgi:hypothetical protein
MYGGPMPFVTKYYEKEKFLLTVVYGNVKSVEVYDHICELASNPCLKVTFSELADLRRVENVDELTTAGLLWASEKESSTVRNFNSKLIFVADKPAVYGTARQYMGMAQKTRSLIDVVQTIEEALNTLNLSDLYDDVMKVSESLVAKNE